MSGLVRSLLASGTLLTLLVHDTDALFRPLGRTMTTVSTSPLVGLSLFSLWPAEWLWFAHLLAIASLVLVIVGWRPTVTGVLHWWVTFSFVTSSFVVEGGDQIAANLSLLLIPITLTDRRRSHWADPIPATGSDALRTAIAMSAWTVGRIQVAALYLHAAVGKLRVEEWVDGTAAYYWFLHPMFGAADWLRPLVESMLASSFLVTLCTWGAIAVELALFTGLFMEHRLRPRLLAVGLAFHFSIVLLHGLVAFFLAMAGALLLYLHPPHASLQWVRRLRAAVASRHAVIAPRVSRPASAA